MAEGLAAQLGREHPSAAASLREGLDDMFSVRRLGASDRLARSLSCTNAIESMISTVRLVSSGVKRWRDPAMVRRWVGTGMIEAQRSFRRIKGCSRHGTASSTPSTPRSRNVSPKRKERLSHPPSTIRLLPEQLWDRHRNPTGLLHSQALGHINSFTNVWDAALVLFGLNLFVLAYLANRSGYVPKLLCVLLAIAGFGYVFDTVVRVLVRGSSSDISAISGMGEFVFALWLLIRGRRITMSGSTTPSSRTF